MIIEVSDHFSRLNCGHVKKTREALFISCLVGRWMQTQRFVPPEVSSFKKTAQKGPKKAMPRELFGQGGGPAGGILLCVRELKLLAQRGEQLPISVEELC